VKAASLKKGLLKTSDENTLALKNLKDTETLLKLFAANLRHVEKPVEIPAQESVASPQTKRKERPASIVEEDEPFEVNNRAFTNHLREGLYELAEKEKDRDNTVGHYAETYPKQVNQIKRGLNKFVPIGKTFKDAWRMACSAISQERSQIKQGKRSKK